MATQIEPTINILQDLTNAAVKKGVEKIAKWEGDLEKADFTGAKTIHSDLAKLRKHLEGESLDGKAIGALLVKLGESTGHASKHAEGKTVQQLELLGQALVKAGKSLS